MRNKWRSPVWGCALIVLLTLLAYVPAMQGGFIWDDDAYLTDNRALRSAEGLRQIWMNPDATVQYYPLTFTVFWIEYHLWGLHPFGFHLLNVLLQAVNAILFWKLLSRLKVPGSWWAAAIFAVHPVNVMSVAWVTELKNVLSGIFFLAALLSFVKFSGLEREDVDPSTSRKGSYGLAVGFSLCALLAKTATSILPVALVLMLWWKKGRIGRKEFISVMPFFVVGVSFGAFTLWLEKYAKGASGSEFNLSFLDRFLVAGRAFWFCLGKLFWPTQLTFIYPRWQIDPTAIWQYGFPLAAIALLVTLWSARRRIGRAPLAATLYFTLAFPALVMVEVLYMMRFSFVADHWQYLGSMSMIPLGVGAAARMFNQRPAAVRRIGPVIGSVVLAALSLLTWRQGYIYRDLETLWRDTLAKNPNAWMAQHNLGKLLQDRGNLAEAMNHYNQALSLKPEYADAHNNLAVVLIQFNRTQEAIGHWEEALRIKPGFADAHYNLGGALVRLGRLQEAIGHYELAARLKPDDAPTQNDLGAALAQIGRVDEGITHCEEALRLRPDYAEAHYNLGMAFAQEGKLQDAAQHWEQALRIKPDYSEAHYNLGVALEQMGKPIEAMRHWEQALKLWPDYPEAENKLAWWLAMLAPNEGGDPARALSLAKSACKLTDNRSATHLDTLAAAYAAAGQFPDAIATAQRAIELARAGGQTKLAAEIESRLQLYRAGQPYRQSASR